MYFLFLTAILVANCGEAHLGEIENCDPSELKICVEIVPRTPVGLPQNKKELDAHCLAYQTGMTCMDVWMKRCLPTDGQKLAQRQIGGARTLMHFLCTNETALRREFLNGSSCWALVSADWSRCVEEMQIAVRDITERSHQIAYNNRHPELCCARDAFVSCVAYAGRTCTRSAGTLLRRMAWVLAQDVAACSQHPSAHCDAPHPPLATPLLAMISSFIIICPWSYHLIN